MLVTTGISTSSNYWGTSYSLDRGRNWTTIETANQRGVLGIADSLHMWCGGFTTSPQSDGIFKWEGISLIGCNDPNVNSGTTTATRDTVCFGDTSVIHTSGIFAPVNGDYFGFSYAISAQPISGSLDPNNEPSIVGSYRIRMPAVATDSFNLINDTSFFGNPQGPPFGTYYLTPVAFGNATAATSPPIRFLGDVVLDPNCTYTGTSVRVTIVPPGVAPCPPVGVNEIYSRMLTVTSTMKDKTTLDIGIGSAKSGRALIQVLDLTGRVLRTLEFNVNEGMNHELVNVESLASGTYLIKAEMNGAKSTGKVFKY
jgi:hypothetical protein